MKIELTPMLLDSDQFNIGNPVIDSQHKDLIDLINDLYCARFSGNRTEIRSLLESMIEPTIRHFSDEEALMELIGYPELNQHKDEHAKLLEDSATYANRFDAGEDIAAELQAFLFDWLIKHIRNSDKKIVEFQQAMNS